MRPTTRLIWEMRSERRPFGPDIFLAKTEKRISDIHGLGLYSREPMAKGEIVVVKGGHVMSKEQRDALGQYLEDTEIQIADGLFMGPDTQQERAGGMMHLNHSCEPNLGLQGQIVFVALRDIGKDEELTFDYANTDDEEYEMRCICGARTCRGVVTGRDWQKKEIQERYRGYFSWFLQKKISESRQD